MHKNWEFFEMVCIWFELIPSRSNKSSAPSIFRYDYCLTKKTIFRSATENQSNMDSWYRFVLVFIRKWIPYVSYRYVQLDKWNQNMKFNSHGHWSSFFDIPQMMINSYNVGSYKMQALTFVMHHKFFFTFTVRA